MAKAKAKTVTPKVAPVATSLPVEAPKVEKPVAPKEPKVVEHRQGPFGGGSSDHAYAAANEWAIENNINTPNIGVGYDRDTNKYEAWVTYETTE